MSRQRQRNIKKPPHRIGKIVAVILLVGAVSSQALPLVIPFLQLMPQLFQSSISSKTLINNNIQLTEELENKIDLRKKDIRDLEESKFSTIERGDFRELDKIEHIQHEKIEDIKRIESKLARIEDRMPREFSLREITFSTYMVASKGSDESVNVDQSLPAPANLRVVP
jgi:hypothetical protein